MLIAKFLQLFSLMNVMLDEGAGGGEGTTVTI
jgi:hypothetical protein